MRFGCGSRGQVGARTYQQRYFGRPPRSLLSDHRFRYHRGQRSASFVLQLRGEPRAPTRLLQLHPQGVSSRPAVHRLRQTVLLHDSRARRRPDSVPAQSYARPNRFGYGKFLTIEWLNRRDMGPVGDVGYSCVLSYKSQFKTQSRSYYIDILVQDLLIIQIDVPEPVITRHKRVPILLPEKSPSSVQKPIGTSSVQEKNSIRHCFSKLSTTKSNPP